MSDAHDRPATPAPRRRDPAPSARAHTTRSIPLDAGAPGVVAAARTAARAFVTDHPRADDTLVETVGLVVSELVTNAVRHAPGPCVLELEHTEARVRVTVHDTAGAHPVPRPRDPQRPHGHGLELVRSLAVLSVLDTPTGKAVTARVPYSRTGPDPETVT
ncbi:ATP-binding protein [Embleya sp. NPDC050154]|uniref:ATP-binding protein n=1 Tax=Embleya sp. NPDC050154 TaxID=3363988 RepID=UPI0037BBB1AB